jgi:GntR family transcriptional regulator, transcriptional repressor for pyruvate dehydrogenase complex
VSVDTKEPAGSPAAPSVAPPLSDGTVFAPVRSQTAFEETVERLGTAIKLGLLPPGTRLPAERELCRKLGIARSTLRQALLALGQTGHLQATRGRRGGTFVADPQPPTEQPSEELLAQWGEVCDSRMALEVGVAVLAAQRADNPMLDALEVLVGEMDHQLGDYSAYRQSDVRFHVGLAECTGSTRLIAAMTVTQGEMTDLISHISHPEAVLGAANDQHRRLIRALRAHDSARAARIMAEQVEATTHILGGLLPSRG